MLVANEMLGAKVLAANEVGDMWGGEGLSDGSKREEPKIGRSEGQKLAKSRKSSKSKSEKSKKPPKSGNSHNFDAMEAGSSFLTPKARAAFNHLRLAFIKAPIL